MKKSIDFIIRVMLSLAVTFSCLLAPLDVNAAIKEGDTLKDLKNELQELKNKKTKLENEKKLTQTEIKQAEENMKKADYDMYRATEEISKTEKSIEQTEAEIEEVKKGTEELLRLNQKQESDNIYLSYITGASSMTELIMRSDMIAQLTRYNEAEIRKLELLTESNKKLTASLEDYKKELEVKRAEYEKEKDKLGEEVKELEEGAVSVDDEIKSMESLIKYYTDLGCKDNQDLVECVRIKNNTGWLKPVTKGVITDLFGYRGPILPGVSSNHKGIDIGVAEGTSVYPTAEGQVGAIVRKSSCGGNMLYIWTYVGGRAYTYVYMHLKEILVSVGETVKVDQVVAKSGGKSYGYDRCTTGPHLHYGLAPDHHFGAPGDLALSKFSSHVINPPGFPGYGQYFYGR